MQHLQYGINSLLKFTIARSLPLLKGILRHIIFLVPSLRPASPSPPSDCPRLWLTCTLQNTNDFIVLNCIVQDNLY